jgi:hypothetical protein
VTDYCDRVISERWYVQRVHGRLMLSSYESELGTTVAAGTYDAMLEQPCLGA